jgi:hypothetical protein
VSHGLETVRARHTCAHRARELLAIVARLQAPSPSHAAAQPGPLPLPGRGEETEAAPPAPLPGSGEGGARSAELSGRARASPLEGSAA